MSANSVFLIVLALFILAILALAAACAKLSLKWSRVAEVSLFKSLGLALLMMVTTNLLTYSMIYVLTAVSGSHFELAEGIICLVNGLLMPAILIALIFKTRFTRALWTTVLYLLLSVPTSLGLAYAIRTFAYEAFFIPTNGMAPTLLGVHWTASCPNCGAPAYGSPPDSQFARIGPPPEGISMVCSKEKQMVYVTPSPQEAGDGDRILACKILAPRRWDLIVFRYPEDPSLTYVKRLVGLPNEKLEIRDGAVWINGEKQIPPESIRAIPYLPTINSPNRTYDGPGSNPVELGPDEYFVLGDFVDQSADSRMWEHGAPGHPPYAVPNENIIGVVINIYWPVNRWKSFR